MDYCLDYNSHKHILFIRPIEIDTIYRIIRHGKFKKSIIFDEKKIIYENQEIMFKFDPNSNSQLVIGLESEIINLEDHDRFYSITEYIGSFKSYFSSNTYYS
jgi:hypothetical protein